LHHTDSVLIAAPVEAVWAVLVDVTRWPEWTPTMTEVRLLDADALRPGARVRIVQPRLPTVTWTVDAVDAPWSFSWVVAAPGGRSRATHELADAGEGRTRVRLGVEQTGIAAVFGALTRSLTRRYVRLEAESLRSRCEGRTP